MIELYLSIAKKLKEIPELKYIDIDGSEEIKTSPAAFVSLGKIPWESMAENHQYAEFPFSVKLDITPYHRSGADAPVTVLDNLASNLGVINAVKDKLLKEGTDLITGIEITGEDLRKQNGKYSLLLDFKGYVSYEP